MPADGVGVPAPGCAGRPGRPQRQAAGWFRPVRAGTGRMVWDQAIWEAQLMGSGLPRGVIATGLVLSAQADEHGVAVVPLARLAEISLCHISSAHARKQKLIIAGFVARDGRAVPADDTGQGRTVNRYQLVMPVIEDVSKYISGPMGGGYA